MPLPTLTFATSTRLYTGYSSPTDAQIIDYLIANAAAALPASWRVISSVASTYIELGAPSGSPVEDMRVIIGINPTTAYLPPDSSSNAIWIGYTYDCDGQSIGTWNSTTPYGGTVNFTGYTKSCASGVAESLRFICSAETFAVFWRDDSADKQYGTHLGAIFDPLTGSAMPDGRLFGLITSSTSFIDMSFWQYGGVTNQWMTHGNTNGNNHVYCIRPTDPTKVDKAPRQSAIWISPTQQLTFLNNVEALPVINYNSDVTPRYQVGVLRQVHPVQDRIDDTPVSGGIILAKSNATPYDAMLFRNV